MLNLSLSVIEETSLVSREAERVESNVTGHGTIQNSRPLGEGQRLRFDHCWSLLLGGGVEGGGGGGSGSIGSRGDGEGTCEGSEEEGGGEGGLHICCLGRCLLAIGNEMFRNVF